MLRIYWYFVIFRSLTVVSSRISPSGVYRDPWQG